MLLLNKSKLIKILRKSQNFVILFITQKSSQKAENNSTTSLNSQNDSKISKSILNCSKVL